MIKRSNKKFKKILCLTFCLFFAVNVVYATSNDTTLKDLRDKLAKYEKESQDIIKKKEEVNKKINGINNELGIIAKDIEESDQKIQEAQLKIEKLEIDIDNKKLEIDNLINFEQISSGDNIYLEYIFNAKTFTDFIYRVSIVEQLSKYNDELIDDMNKLIDENKKTKEDLKLKIEENENQALKLNELLNKYNLTVDDLTDEHVDVKEDLIASQKEVKAYETMYKKYGCKETDTILDCMKIPYADGLTRPLNKGYIGTKTSEFGMRFHPTQHVYKMHYGLDIGTPMGSKVYASAAGIVSKITRVSRPDVRGSSCGGNKIYIKHRINGQEYTTVYMHLHTINPELKAGQSFVTLDTVIGTSGGGESYDRCTTGPHLHFGVMKGSTYVNPRNYVKFPPNRTHFYSRWY